MKIDRKREMRRAMQHGHSPSKAVSIADALHRKASMAGAGTPSNVETVNPKTGTAGDQAGNFTNPTAMAEGGIQDPADTDETRNYIKTAQSHQNNADAGVELLNAEQNPKPWPKTAGMKRGGVR